jgi:hypothetical protein
LQNISISGEKHEPMSAHAARAVDGAAFREPECEADKLAIAKISS